MAKPHRRLERGRLTHLTAWMLLVAALALTSCDEAQSQNGGDEGSSPSEDGSVADIGDADALPPIPDGGDTPNWQRFPDAFRIVMMRGVAPEPFVQGNSLESFEAALEQDVTFVEADFRMSKDDHLVATHHANMGGDCGNVGDKTLEELRECRLSGGRRVATLADLLSMDFEQIYIDLKENGGESDARLLAAIREAIERIEAAERTDSAVLMLYRVTDDVAQSIEEHKIRAGTKGYPSSDEEVRELIDLAARHGMETMCINASSLSAELVHYSASRGVWQLPWDHARESNIPHWQELAAAGIGGMIVDTRRIISENVEPHWRDVRRQLGD